MTLSSRHFLVALTAQAKESKEQKNKNTSKPNVILIYAERPWAMVI